MTCTRQANLSAQRLKRWRRNKGMTTQQDFLRAAMAELGMTREAFSGRLGCARRTLDKWLLPTTSKDAREMDETIWNLVREILAHEKLKATHEKASKKIRNRALYIPIGDIYPTRVNNEIMKLIGPG